MSVEYDVRSRYLALALEARRVIDLLLPLVETGQKDPVLNPSLTALAETLDSGGSAETLLARLQTQRQPPVYEDLLTLEEIESPKDRERLASQLRNVMSEQVDIESQKASAKQAILFLYTVEGSALRHFSQHSETYASLPLIP